MDSTDANAEELDHVLTVEMASIAGLDLDPDMVAEDQITPLLTQPEPDKPRLDIFSVSYPKRKTTTTNTDHGDTRLTETETSSFTQFIMWTWSGSRDSGLLCMALSSFVYCFIGILADLFSAQAIPLFEIAFARCIVVSALALMWLRRSAQPIFGPANVGSLFVSRAVTGCISLMTFIYCIQRLPLSQAMLLSLTTPIMASISARFILYENLKISEIAGIVFSFFGVIFILQSKISMQGTDVLQAFQHSSLSKILYSCGTIWIIPMIFYSKKMGYHFRPINIWAGQPRTAYFISYNCDLVQEGQQKQGIHKVYLVLIGILSSLTSGLSYCLIRAGAKPFDQPVGTIFSFGLLSSPVAAICMITFEDFVLPGFYSFLLMIILGIFSFIAELFLARALQLEKTSKVANIQYLEVVLSQLWGLASSRVTPSFGRLVGCLIILVSTCSTVYFGPEKDME